MLTMRVISRLMAYPTEETVAAVSEMREVLERENALTGENRKGLEAFLDYLVATPLMRLQENYVALFDRGRHLSLHLFEHVHGESRDRGQAMVELINYYREAGGLELDAHELPDYLPLLLEFLSTRDRQEVQAMLNDAMAVIVLLGARLRERESDYAVLFDSLVDIGGEPPEAAEMRRQAATEGPDEAITKMDEIWEEEQVTFLANQDPASGSGCPAGDAGSPREMPIQWMENPATKQPGDQTGRR